ncbi:MAG: efflux RND transporter periplasmic adaptor subunit [Gemmataceae bacterium]|nr:efflux RND transporter periplasmic adaptor subunit [Gemmataceae bacterium]
MATLPGVVVPARQLRVSPKVPGQIVELLIDEGTQVKAGQVLARLERTAYELEYKQAVAQVERRRALLAAEQAQGAKHEEQIKQAEAALQEAAAQREHRQAEATRLQALVKARAVTAEVAQEAEAQLRMAAARLQQAVASLKVLQKAPRQERVAAARAALAATEAQRDLAKFRLDSTEVRAPIRGIILAKQVQVGDFVRPDALVEGRSVSLCELADLAQLEAVVQVPEADLAKVFAGQKCTIRVGAIPGTVYQGRVVRIAPTISPSTRTLPVRVRMEIPKADRMVRPGMHAVVKLLAKE